MLLDSQGIQSDLKSNLSMGLKGWFSEAYDAIQYQTFYTRLNDIFTKRIGLKTAFCEEIKGPLEKLASGVGGLAKSNLAAIPIADAAEGVINGIIGLGGIIGKHYYTLRLNDLEQNNLKRELLNVKTLDLIIKFGDAVKSLAESNDKYAQRYAQHKGKNLTIADVACALSDEVANCLCLRHCFLIQELNPDGRVKFLEFLLRSIKERVLLPQNTIGLSSVDKILSAAFPDKVDDDLFFMARHKRSYNYISQPNSNASSSGQHKDAHYCFYFAEIFYEAPRISLLKPDNKELRLCVSAFYPDKFRHAPDEYPPVIEFSGSLPNAAGYQNSLEKGKLDKLLVSFSKTDVISCLVDVEERLTAIRNARASASVRQENAVQSMSNAPPSDNAINHPEISIVVPSSTMSVSSLFANPKEFIRTIGLADSDDELSDTKSNGAKSNQGSDISSIKKQLKMAKEYRDTFSFFKAQAKDRIRYLEGKLDKQEILRATSAEDSNAKIVPADD